MDLCRCFKTGKAWLGNRWKNLHRKPINPCVCGEHYCCFRHNYDVVGDGVARLKLDKALKCKKWREAVHDLIDADLVSQSKKK